MVVNINSSLYKVSCSKCSWEKEIMLKNFPNSLLEEGDNKPKKCPKCGEKLKRSKILIKY